MSMNKTWAISSWISFLISMGIFVGRAKFTRRIVALTRGPAENRAGRKHALQAPFQFYGKDGTKFPKNCPGRCVGLRDHSFRSASLNGNGTLELASRIENANLAGTEARATLSVIDCLALLGKNRLNAGCLENFPAP